MSMSPKVQRERAMLNQKMEEASQRRNDDRTQKVLHSRFTATNNPTSTLFLLCQEYDWNPDVTLVAECVKKGAEVLFSEEDESWPLLHWLALLGRVEAVQACLRTSNPIDFTLKNEAQSTFLHCILYEKLTEEQSMSMLRAVLERVGSPAHAADKIEWLQPDYEGFHFLSRAAQNQLLSVVAPLVLDTLGGGVAGFSATTIPLTRTAVWEWDWKALPAAYHLYFELDPDALPLPSAKPTARLLKLSNETFPSLSLVQTCVADGGDVMFQALKLLPQLSSHDDSPLLSKFLWKPFHDAPHAATAVGGGGSAPPFSLQNNLMLQLLEACLKSPKPIAFHTADHLGCTFFHAITNASLQWKYNLENDAAHARQHQPQPPSEAAIAAATIHEHVRELVEAILQRVLQRLQSPAGQKDEVDWSRQSRKGHEALAYAAEAGHLSVWVRVLKQFQVPYLLQAGAVGSGKERILLTKRVRQDDWDRLSAEDKSKFEVLSGFY